MKNQAVTPAVLAFHELHKSGCFLMANPWDAGSAKILHHLGFKALASTSAGFAFSLAKPDSASTLRLEEVLDHLATLVNATPLPLNADFQSGYAETPDGVFENVTRCARLGVAGLSIEDSTGNAQVPLFELDAAVHRLRAARAAIDESGCGTLLTARSEAFLVGARNADRIAIDRLVVFAEAGADCLFAPGVTDLSLVAEMVRTLAPKPVNVLVSRPIPGFSVAALTEIGVRRISLGSALSRMALGSMLQAATSILESGTFESLGSAASFAGLNRIFQDS